MDSSGNIYVSDTENNRIQKLDSSGNYVTSWGTLGSGNGNFKSPAGIAVSGNYVYVADMGNYRIQKFDLNGSYVSSLGSNGTGNTQFNSCIAVANDSPPSRVVPVLGALEPLVQEELDGVGGVGHEQGQLGPLGRGPRLEHEVGRVHPSRRPADADADPVEVLGAERGADRPQPVVAVVAAAALEPQRART